MLWKGKLTSRNGWDAPVVLGVGSPSKPEQASREQGGANNHGRQSTLGNRLASVLLHELRVDGLVGEIDEDGAEDSDKDAEEGERRDDEAVFALLQKDDGVDLQCQKQQAVHERSIKSNKGDSRLGEKHTRRLMLDMLMAALQGGEELTEADG